MLRRRMSQQNNALNGHTVLTRRRKKLGCRISAPAAVPGQYPSLRAGNTDRLFHTHGTPNLFQLSLLFLFYRDHTQIGLEEGFSIDGCVLCFILIESPHLLMGDKT